MMLAMGIAAVMLFLLSDAKGAGASQSGSNQCTEGQFFDGQTCELCPVGQYTFEKGQEECKSCYPAYLGSDEDFQWTEVDCAWCGTTADRGYGQGLCRPCTINQRMQRVSKWSTKSRRRLCRVTLPVGDQEPFIYMFNIEDSLYQHIASKQNIRPTLSSLAFTVISSNAKCDVSFTNSPPLHGGAISPGYILGGGVENHHLSAKFARSTAAAALRVDDGCTCNSCQPGQN